ncbi:endonuclease/exonuclease/phosphatase family protein [Chitinophaga pendula]|uniref:endonuclease/exonuclease/phosphatase family protein n=1 Tax=Chitinophaga TaxID=79328 RepID=UPI000BAFB045|nr:MULTISPECIES: endonuclease/exonuclease/phosphatase family protein [Chitinophaga]ASZ10884.1 endonuclease [Chitinophaga sp. MD30]UCJ06133.1 endonuclease/exonuclease/phosphatase family protein [Chitinophaga pendula]
MKKILLLCCSLSISGMMMAQSALQVMTFNIRMNTSSDSLNAWPYRKDKVASQVFFHQAHLLGVQEALHDQMVDLQQRLPQYKSLGVGREDGKTAGEYSAIFYDTTRLQLLEGHTFWLSETPEVAGSKGWDAAITRIVTWGKFRDRITKKIFFHFNTHFDHMGVVARRESAHFLLKQVQRIAGTTPAIITGDFNATPDDEPIRVVVDQQDPLHLTDSKSLSRTPHYGPDGTFNGWHIAEREDQPIDYIFLKGRFVVQQHATISETWKGRYASDHFAVLSRLLLQ